MAEDLDDGNASGRGGGRLWLATAALSGLAAVAFGAAASHLLAGLPEVRAGWIETGLRYQMLHTAALLAVAILALVRPSRLIHWAGVAFGCGILLFSGLLYVMGLGGPRWLGAVVPLGGLAYLVGWSLLLVFALKRKAG